MRYHASLLCLLAIAESVCAELGEYTPFPKPVLKAGAMAPKSDNPSLGAFTEFASRVAQTPSLSKRQSDTCPASNMHLCSTGGCCPDGYDCESNGTEKWCCPTGKTCTGEGYCQVGTTDCRSVNGGDGCCPTATTFCDKDSSGKFGCREITGTGSSGLCVDAGYYPCADLSGCCKTGTTCVTGADYCQKSCDTGYSECYGGCCSPGYTCSSSTQNCKRVSGSASLLASTTRRTSVVVTSTRVLRSSTTVNAISSSSPGSESDLEPVTPDDTETSTTSSSSTTRAMANPATTTTGGEAAETALIAGPSGGSSLGVPMFLGLTVIALCALFQL